MFRAYFEIPASERQECAFESCVSYGCKCRPRELVSSTEDGLRRNMKIDETIYVERNTSTAVKLSILRRLFVLYKADPMDLVFYLKDANDADSDEIYRHEIQETLLELCHSDHPRTVCR